MENNSNKRGNEFKSYNDFSWVWYKRNLKSNKLVYINSKDNEWNIQNDVVKKINLLVKEGKMGKYGVEFDFVLKCEAGKEIKGFIEVNGDEYETKEFEVKKSSNMMLVFSWDKEMKKEDDGSDSDKRIKISLELDK